jgi:hypothetical protein
MQDLASVVTDYEPDVEQPEAGCWNDDKVHGADGVTMIP